jgi:hypothetical protein
MRKADIAIHPSEIPGLVLVEPLNRRARAWLDERVDSPRYGRAVECDAQFALTFTRAMTREGFIMAHASHTKEASC